MRFATVVRILAIVFAIHAAAMLAWRGSGLTPVAPDVLLFGETLLSALLAPVETFIVRPLLTLVGHTAEPLPHWKHIFVLLWLTASSFGLADYRWSSAPILCAGWGGVCALMSGAAAGAMPLTDANVYMAAGIGMAAFAFVPNLWVFATADRSFQEFVIFDYVTLFLLLVFFAISGAPLFASESAYQYRDPQHALAWQMIYLVFAVLQFLILGAFDPSVSGTRWEKLRASPFTWLGINMAAIAVGTVLLIGPSVLRLTDAG